MKNGTKSFGKFYGRVCSLTRLLKLGREMASYGDWVLVDAQKVRGCLFLAAMLHHDFPSLSQDRLFLCLEKAQKLLRRENHALHSFSDGGQSRQENRKGSTDMFYTYIIRSVNHPDQRYIGSTSDLRKRLAKHNEGGVPHTAPFKPWKLEVYIAFETKEKAVAFEAYLKTGSGHAFSNHHF